MPGSTYAFYRIRLEDKQRDLYLTFFGGFSDFLSRTKTPFGGLVNAPAYPADEFERLLALQSTGLLDTPPEERFDRITRLAARFFGVKTCLLSLLDSDKQWFKSRVGLEENQLGRDISFCGHAILNRGILTVADARKDTRFSANPLVTSVPHIRFYAGAPVRGPGGLPIGTLCLFDPSPRRFSDEQKQALRDFADMVEHEITRNDQAGGSQRRLTASAIRASSILATMPDMVFVIDHHLRFLVCNEHPDLSQPRLKILGQTIEEVLPGELGVQLTINVQRAFNSKEVIQHNYTLAKNTSFEARCVKIDQNEVLVIIRNTTEQTLISAELSRLSDVFKKTTNGVVITDQSGFVLWINEAYSDITGYSPDEMVGSRPGVLLQGKDTNPATVEAMDKAAASRKSYNVDVLNYKKSGASYWVRITCDPLWDDDGQFKGCIAIKTDITKEKRDAGLLSYNEELLKSVIDANNIGTWRLNLQSGELVINEKWAHLLGYKLHELMPTNRKTWENLTHPEDLACCALALDKHSVGLIPAYEADIRMKHKNGDWVWINTRGRVLSNTEDGKAEWLLGTHFDINDRVMAQRKSNEQSKQMHAIVENMQDGVVTISNKGIIRTFNHGAECIFGYGRDEMIGLDVNVLINAPHRKYLNKYISKYMSRKTGNAIYRHHEFEALNKDGTVFPIEVGMTEVQPLGDINFVGIIRDITQRKKREDEIHQLAFYDPLTLLPNRRLLKDRLQQIVANCVRQNYSAALLFLDLDNFKNVNDSLGHNKGDLLLCQVAARLIESVRRGGTVSHLGGDEFVVLIEGLSTDRHEAAVQVEAAAGKISAQLAQEFDLDGSPYNGSASIGVTTFNSNLSSLEDLLKQADMALYKAKAADRSSVHFFDPQMQVVASLRAAMQQDLYEALRKNQFQLYYQKQIDQHERLTGVEALLRWVHPTKGFISPAQFIPLAEETGLIVPIGEWVLREACQTLAEWASDPAKANLTIAVNISVVQFNKKNIVHTVLNALNASGAKPHNLKLEITESLLASDVENVKVKMLELQHHGVTFSIDDFGTGYSSLFYLKQLPIHQLKIDQSFVRDIINSPNDQAIAQAVITLAIAMHLNVIAEGVETEAQRAMLQDLGCGAYQGYLFGKPCALQDLFV
jgi:diguanylate cyclase (GGDEF)-like protein/PAS domain S-box-containing protein